MAWTSEDDVIDSWIGNDVPTDMGLVARWIGRAERLLRREFPNLQARVNAGGEPELEETIRDVVTAMVTRVFRNPEGIRQMQETDGSFTGSITFSGDQPGALALLDSERDALRDPGAASSGQAFSIHMNSGDSANHVPWCDRTWDASRCSCGVVVAGRPIYETG